MDNARHRRRGDYCGLAQGQPLLLLSTAYDLALGYAEFRQHTGLTDQQIITTPVTAIPLPAYPIESDAAHDQRWPRVSPEALWHPSFWLPAPVWQRQVQDGLSEPDPIWAIRICLQLADSRLWTATDGWTDILASRGIDTDNPDHMARVLAWQAGGADDDLDHLDLSGYFDPTRQEELTASAAALWEPLQHAAWSAIADELLSYVDEAEGDYPVLPRIDTIVNLGIAFLSDVEPEGAAPGTEFWAGIEEAVEDCRDDEGQLLTGPCDDIRTWAAMVRSEYATGLQDLATLSDTVKSS